jgi:hypothetical protein
MAESEKERAADDAAASALAANLALDERIRERVVAARMASGEGPWPVSDDDGKVIWVTEAD